MKKVFGLLLLCVLPIILLAQTVINPKSQIRWPAVTDTVNPAAPNWPCAAVNFGQPFTNVTTGSSFVCAASGWTAVGTTGVPITGTPAVGDVPIATSPTAAVWGPLPSGTVSGTQNKIGVFTTLDGKTIGATNMTTDDTGDPLTVPGSLNVNVTDPPSNLTFGTNDHFTLTGDLARPAVTSHLQQSICDGVGWNFGNAANVSNADWSTCQFGPKLLTTNVRGISQAEGGIFTKNATGDFAWNYPAAFYTVGGMSGRSDEGAAVYHSNGGELASIYMGVVAAGATTGATTLPISTGNVTCDGCFFAFQAKGASSHFAGPPVVSPDNRYFIEPVVEPVTPSTAYAELSCSATFTGTVTAGSATITNVSSLAGIVLGQSMLPSSLFAAAGEQNFVVAMSGTTITLAAPAVSSAVATTLTSDGIPQLPNQSVPQSSACSAHILGGSTGVFTTGIAGLADTMSEQVQITSVGTVDGSGNQPVTILHRNPSSSASMTLWQGGTQGTFQFHPYIYFNLGGHPQYEEVFGSTDATHVVSMVNSGGGLIPSQTGVFTTTANSTLTNVVVTGTAFTATVDTIGNFGILVPAGAAGAVLNNALTLSVSACASTTYNVTLTQYDISTSTLAGTVTAGSASCAQATINFPPNYTEVHFLCGAEQIHSDTPGSVNLEPNNCDWTPGDQVWEAHPPTFGYLAHWDQIVINNLQAQGNGVFEQYQGSGITNLFHPIRLVNTNPDNVYVGAGGIIGALQWMSLEGPNGNVLSAEFPLNGGSIFNFNCGTVCDNLHTMWNLGGGQSTFTWYEPTNHYDFNLASLSVRGITSPSIATGDGSTFNGGFPNLAGQVALWSLNSAQGGAPGAGSTGFFGSGAQLAADSSMTAGGFFAGILNGGAIPPVPIGSGGNGVGPTGPPNALFTYACSANTSQGESLLGPAFLVNGWVTMNTTNYAYITCYPGVGGSSINVYRTVAVGPYAAGKICDHISNFDALQNPIPLTSPGCRDTGQNTTGAAPIKDTSGKAHIGGPLDADVITATSFVGGSFQGTGAGAFVGSNTATNTDLVGEVTLVAGAGVYTFAKTLINRPECFVHDHTTPANDATLTFVVTNTSITFTGIGMDVIGYGCIGRN